MTLEFGFAKEIITPAYGLPLRGYFNPRPNKGAYDDLALKAVLFRTGTTIAGFVSYDLCMLSQELVERMIAEAKQAGLGFADNVMFAATHTHTGPYIDSRCAKYVDELVAKTINALKRAADSMAPAELLHAKTQCTTLAFNRRYWMKSGIVLTNPGKLNPEIDRPEGNVDYDIQLFAVRQAGRLALLMANIVNHTDTIGGNIVSADWPGRMERAIQAEIGYDIPVVTLVGPQGNINHFNVATDADQTSYAEACRIGKGYAAVINAALYQLLPLEVADIAVANTIVEVPYYEVGDDQYTEALKVYEKYKDEEMEDGRDFTSEDIARKHPFVLKYFAKRLIDCHDRPPRPKRLLRMLAIRLGKQACFVSIPAEPFTEIGQDIKKRSKYAVTVPVALAQGAVGYVGYPEHYERGGYETSPSPETAGKYVGQSFVDTAGELIARV